jgi:hypothetical protein
MPECGQSNRARATASLADVALQSGSHAEAARFFGAADAIRGRMGAVRFKVFDPAHEKSASAVRAALGDHDFDEA